GPRTTCPFSTSYADWCHGQTSRPSSIDPPARSARRCRHRRVTAKNLPSMFPMAYGPARVTAPGGRSATGHTVICFAISASSHRLRLTQHCPPTSASCGETPPRTPLIATATGLLPDSLLLLSSVNLVVAQERPLPAVRQTDCPEINGAAHHQ